MINDWHTYLMRWYGYGKKFKSLATGAVIGVYSEKDGWAKIDPKAALWVSKKYLKPVVV